METEKNKLTKPVETSERPEIIGGDKEDNLSMDTQCVEIWSQIGDMTLTEGIKAAWLYIKKLKIKQVALGVTICMGILLGGFIIYQISYGLWTIANECYAMAVGENDDLLYSFFEGHLHNSIPFSIIVAVIIGLVSDRHKLILVILYFIMLLSILEIWNYWHIEYGANKILGGLCFVIMFIIVPILYLIKWLIPIFSDNSNDVER